VGEHKPLRAEEVRRTVQKLHRRIRQRFPRRGLTEVCAGLVTLVDEVTAGSASIAGRLRVARVVSRTLMALVLAATLVALALATRDALSDGSEVDSSLDVLPLIETVVNDVVFAAIAVFFLWSFPERLQRRPLLALLHQLRSTAHIIDMHQLTKDPERLREGWSRIRTEESPDARLTRDEMERYLDYCSEMLSLVGKTAALCAEESQDTAVLETVSTIESLTVGLSRKIWQKIQTLPAS
jgi:hypothetical protein